MDVDRLASRMNPLVVWILRSRLHGLLSSALMLLSFTGRRSGRPITLPVGYQREGDVITVLASRARRKQWWRNFSEPRRVEMLVRGRARTGQARLVSSDSEEFAAAVAATFQRLPGLGRQFGIAFDRSRGLTAEQRSTVASEGALVRIALDPR